MRALDGRGAFSPEPGTAAGESQSRGATIRSHRRHPPTRGAVSCIESL